MIIPDEHYFQQDAVTLAKDLIGYILLHDDGAIRRSGVIVETEAYTDDDPASHAYRGKTSRNKAMFEQGGVSYVYLIYGMYHCFNVVTGPKGSGEAVLIRALEPLEGILSMQETRGVRNLRNLCSGPGKLCQALGISTKQNGISLFDSELRIAIPDDSKIYSIETDCRIGISKASDRKWRFYAKNSQWVSR